MKKAELIDYCHQLSNHTDELKDELKITTNALSAKANAYGMGPLSQAVRAPSGRSVPFSLRYVYRRLR